MGGGAYNSCMTDKEKYGTLTEAELDAFDQKAREQFEQSRRITQALRQAQKKEADPAPGTEEAKELIRDAIRQGGEWKEEHPRWDHEALFAEQEGRAKIGEPLDIAKPARFEQKAE